MPIDDYLVPLDNVLIDTKARAQLEYYMRTEYPREIAKADENIAAAGDVAERKRLAAEKLAFQKKYGQEGNAGMRARNVKAQLDRQKDIYTKDYRAIGLPPGASAETVRHFRAHIRKNWGAKDPTGVKAIVWRSDTRSPATIFSEGFAARDVSIAGPRGWFFKGDSLLTAPTFRTDPKDMDIDPGGGVCLAVDVRATAFFPLDTNEKKPWVYAMILGEGYNTYRIQKEVAGQTGDVAKVWKYKERVACTVSSWDVLAAVQMERRFTKPGASTASDIQEGVEFRFDPGTLCTSWWGWLKHATPGIGGFDYGAMIRSIRQTVGSYTNWSPPQTYSLTDTEATALRDKLQRKGLMQ